jgi:hypothetical protein
MDPKDLSNPRRRQVRPALRLDHPRQVPLQLGHDASGLGDKRI